MKRKLQVFISSTFTDLKEERQVAVQAVLNVGHIPVGMELFTAGDESQKEMTKSWIEESDVFMLILGGRYGSIDRETGKSYTHWEYDYAEELGKPRIVIVLSENAIQQKIEFIGYKDAAEQENPQMHKDFRERIISSTLVSFVDDTKEIELRVFQSLLGIERSIDLSRIGSGNEQKKKMNFYITGFSKNFSIPKEVSEYPSVVLMSDTWNDHGYETYFHFYYIDQPDSFELIGAYKILNKMNNVTRFSIPNTFKRLDRNYCSLGQNVEFYEKLRDVGFTEVEFACLNDAALNEEIYSSFREEKGFTDSLLRWSEASKALKEAKQYFGRVIDDKNLDFIFNYKIPNATSPHIVNLNFNKSELPYRINSFVGKNATGKTKILTQLASGLSGAVRTDSFYPERPSFSKVIAISYSAFDELFKPFKEVLNADEEDDILETEKTRKEETVFFSYVYCGLRTKKGILSLKDIEDNFFKAFDEVKNKDREDQWTKIMSNVLEKESLDLIKSIREDNRLGQSRYSLNSLFSSGQNIMISTMTEVIANIELDSILLFDEPEIHLHPNAIANFMRMFYEILEEFESYAILSTHSPLIIQEIPSKYVHVFSRFSNTPVVEPLYNECFGENISTITNDVFEVREHESNYKTWLKRMSEEHTKEKIIGLFENDLSFNALTYLNSLFHNKSEQEGES
ncbi:DUF4062 domain-containing protein [Paenibacillus sp. FSL K6-2524]|uniref:DUF4062 domain-containing protein n=1 Tax=Paenibacillus sp. FSL K6-2524 TaxID=2954516 RepID=UPI0030F91730